MTNVVNFNFDVPADKTEIIAAFRGLIDTFKNNIEVKKVDIQEQAATNDTNISNILAFAGIGKPATDTPDDINIKDLKFKDREYMTQKYGVAF